MSIFALGGKEDDEGSNDKEDDGNDDGTFPCPMGWRNVNLAFWRT